MINSAARSNEFRVGERATVQMDACVGQEAHTAADLEVSATNGLARISHRRIVDLVELG